MSDAPSPKESEAETPADPGSMTGRELQENASQGPLEVEPGSDADQAAEVPHVG
jgi:hypothetical protein